MGRIATMDLAMREEAKRLADQIPNIVHVVMNGGTGFEISTQLRRYYIEFMGRLHKLGRTSMPSSFNVVSDFMTIRRDLPIFEILSELDYCTRLSDFLDWYTSPTRIDCKAEMLVDLLADNIVHHYQFTGGSRDVQIEVEDHKLTIVGASLVRHGTSLSVLVLAGERPPHPPDKFFDALMKLGENRAAKGREGVGPAAGLDSSSRYLESEEGFGRVIAMMRFDLAAGSFDVQELHTDVGPSWLVLTNHAASLGGEIPAAEIEGFLKGQSEKMKRYEQLFALTASVIYAPAFVAQHADRVRTVSVATELYVSRKSTASTRAEKSLGREAMIYQRDVRWMETLGDPTEGDDIDVAESNLKFEPKGYWRSLQPNEIGEDADGKPVVGKTWVEQMSNWSATPLSSFVARRTEVPPDGPDPGTVYVMRTPANGLDIYKVGLTRRTATERAKELRTTGVPLPFEVLGTWEVGDCGAVEREVHRRLASYRVSMKREFFRAPIARIVQTINAVTGHV